MSFVFSPILNFIYNAFFGEDENEKPKKNPVMSIKNKFMHLEFPDLPRLPVPDLKESCEMYLESVKPLLSQDSFEKTKGYVEELLAGQGPALHGKVVQLSKESPTSYLEGLWDTSYLTYRVPFPCNINPSFGMKDDVLGRNMIQRAASVITSALNFYELVAMGKLPQDKERTTPLCMCQYGKLFGSTRVPVPGRDVYMEYPNSKHVVISCNSSLYRLNISDGQGKRYSEGQLVTLLGQIVTHAAQQQDVPPVGILTGQHRDFWAKVYPGLRKDNSSTLDSVEGGLFLVALDHTLTVGDDINKWNRNLVVGDACNRWYDKSVQFIITSDSKTGINMEHSGFDGHTILILLHNMYSDELKREIPKAEEVQEKDAVTPLTWKLNENLRQAIKTGVSKFDEMQKGMDTVAVDFSKFGSAKIKKSLGFSPDAFVQMAFQLTYFKMFGKPGSTYESANTKRFYHGRTECIRSVTVESVKFTKAWMDDSVPTVEKVKLLREAAMKHVNNVRLAKSGKTPSRLFFAMKSFARQNVNFLPDYTIPKVFTDPNYSLWGTDMMSTSNCSGTPSCQWFAFSPVAEFGFGNGYVIQPDAIHVVVCSFKNKSEEFAKMLMETIEEIEKSVLLVKE